MSGPELQFREFLRDGHFMLQRSRSSGTYVFYPRTIAPATGESDLEWVEASGGATVYAITVIRGRDSAYNVALVDLDEGIRMMTRIEGVESVPIGARVQGRIIQEDGAPLVVFDPVIS